METEQQLLHAIRSGERGAQRRLYDRFAGLVMASALRYIPEREEARDVVQDSFVKILTSLERFTFRGEGSLKAWVMSIVAHQAIDHLKAQQRLVLTEHLLGEEIADEEENPHIGGVPPDVLNRLIGALPTGYRTVLNLYVFEQMSHKEIGRLLGIKPETSASQYLRAKQALAKRINNYLKDNDL